MLIALFFGLLVVVLLVVMLLDSVTNQQPGKPDGLVLEQIGRKQIMADLLTYAVSAAASTAADAVSREVSLVINGAEPVVTVFAPTDTDLGQVTVPQNAEVSISVVDIDDAGNRSEPAVLSFTALDTLPPPAPGAVSVVLVSEDRIPDVAPAVEPGPEADA